MATGATVALAAGSTFAVVLPTHNLHLELPAHLVVVGFHNLYTEAFGLLGAIVLVRAVTGCTIRRHVGKLLGRQK